MKLLFLLSFPLFFYSNFVWSQSGSSQKQIDSLLHIVNSYAKEDTVKLQQYEKLYRNYIKLNNRQEAENYVDKIIKLAKKLHQGSYIAKAYYRLGFYHHTYSRYLQAEECYQKAITEFTNIDDKDLLASTYQNLSAMYANVPDYTKALDANFKAVAIFNETNNLESMAGCYVNIASAYTGLKQYNNAKQYLQKALKIFLSHKGNEYGTALCYVNLGKIYFKADGEELKRMGIAATEKYNKALWYLQQAERFNVDPFWLGGDIYETKANIYRATKQKTQAYQAYQKALQYRRRSSEEKEYATTLLSLAGLYIDDAQYGKAAPLLAEAFEIGKRNKILGLQRDVCLALSTVSEKQGLYNDALKYYKEHIAFREQVFNEEKEKEITRKRLQLDFSIKENEYQAQQHFQQKISVFLGAFILVLLVAALLVYRAQRKTAKLNKLVLLQKEELEQLGKVKDKIFSVVSHDMRTPVNSLISFIALLENGNVSEEKLKRYAANLKNSLGYTSAMMENLLNWAYSQMQGFKPHITQLVLAPTLANLVAVMEEQAAEKHIKISYTGNGQATVLADRDMLLLVLRNLLNNAIKFTPTKGTIELVVSENGGETAILVKDNGVGMSAQEVTDFNGAAHYHIGQTSLGTNKEKGTGLGLSLCKTFVSLMNGKLQLESQPGKGSCFMVILPRGRFT